MSLEAVDKSPLLTAACAVAIPERVFSIASLTASSPLGLHYE